MRTRKPDPRLARVARALALGGVVLCSHAAWAWEEESPLARQVLAENDGWAAADGGVTGGAAAAPGAVHVATDRRTLLAALATGDGPRIIQVRGTINLSVDDDNREMVEQDYADPGYDFGRYVAAYAPAVWNVQPLVKGRPPALSGPLEEARRRSAERQAARVVVGVPSNTTLVGLGDDARVIKGNLRIGPGATNVIIRNIAFSDAFDYFPEWSPDDSFSLKGGAAGCGDAHIDAANGPQRCRGGRWNSEYDLITIDGAGGVWIDHCSFDDGERPDRLFPPVFPAPHDEPEQKVQHHDGLVDIVNGADRVTISNSVFRGHDKAHLIGSSDRAPGDEGRLRVTLRHNHYIDVMQRAPRVRFGAVHVLNCLFEGDRGRAAHPFRYAFGIGTAARLYSEANVFLLDAGATAADVVAVYRGTTFADRGSLLNGRPVDLVVEFNVRNLAAPLSPEVGWTPALYAAPPLPAAAVEAHARAHAGPGKP